MRRLLAAALVLAGLALGGWALLDDTGDDVGALTIGDTAADDTAAIDDAPPADPAAPRTDDGAPRPGGRDEAPSTGHEVLGAGPPGPAPTSSAPPIERRSGRIGDVAATRAPAPVAFTMPRLGIDAAVVPVGVDPDGLMSVPEDVATVGWYRFGSGPASEAGTTVLAGHVDDRVQGRGAFYDLRAVEVGDQITVTDETGTSSSWLVTGRRTFDKASLPVEDLYRRTGPPRLVLITCGGEFDRAARSYEANVVVEAEPVP